MLRTRFDVERRTVLAVAALVCVVGATTATALDRGALAVASSLGAAVALVTLLRVRSTISLSDDELAQLRIAENALAEVEDVAEAAARLADHAIELLGARSAVVLIEGVGDTVRCARGPNPGEDVYGSGSRMRLLDDAGVPCGSIAVSARADGGSYSARHERILDVLAERVSASIHRVSLLSAVEDERGKLADLIASSSDGIFSVGADHRVLAWNPAMAAISGVPIDDALGRPIQDSFRPMDADGAPLTGAADPSRTAPHEAPVELRVEVDGEDRWLSCSYAPLSDGGYVVIARDDTERRKIEEDKNGWIAQVSHELRTPLTPIKGFLKTLVSRGEDMGPEDRAKIYEILLREEERLEELVEAMFRTTQFDAGSIDVHLEAVALDELVRGVVDRWAEKQPQRTVSLAVDRLEPVRSDPDLVGSIVDSLVSNACKYTDVGSPIEVTVEADGSRAVVSVIDHGKGVPRSDRERVFNKFGRLGSHLTRPEQGVGLGLHNARRSAERLGGSVWIDTTPGGGATFRFSLPLAPGGSEST